MVVEKKCLAVSACVSSLILLLAGVGCQQGDSSRTTAASISIPKSPSAGQSIGVFGFHGATVKEGADTMVTWFVERATGATNRKQFSGTEFTINDYEANQSRWVNDICNADVSSVFLFGYSRGGVSALDAAHDLSKSGACGGKAPRVRWVGVVDPVPSLVPNFKSHIERKFDSAI
jgi:pimeloyl-ACP methyl ester carboxylesterase